MFCYCAVHRRVYQPRGDDGDKEGERIETESQRYALQPEGRCRSSGRV
jgi:hypothetical protein